MANYLKLSALFINRLAEPAFLVCGDEGLLQVVVRWPDERYETKM